MIMFLYFLFGIMAVVMALLVVVARNPLISALSLVGTLCAIAALFILMGAYLIAAFQVLLYAGAVTVLFIFVIMVVQFRTDELQLPRLKAVKVLGLLLSVAMSLTIAWIWLTQPITGKSGTHSPALIEAAAGNAQALSQYLFSHYALPFEIASLILLVAIVGSVILARKPAARKATAEGKK